MLVSTRYKISAGLKVISIKAVNEAGHLSCKIEHFVPHDDGSSKKSPDFHRDLKRLDRLNQFGQRLFGKSFQFVGTVIFNFFYPLRIG